MSEGHGVNIEFDGPITKPAVIRRFADIPDILTIEIPPVEYIVPALPDTARDKVQAKSVNTVFITSGAWTNTILPKSRSAIYLSFGYI